MTGSGGSGRIEYQREAFAVEWVADGLRMVVTDDHASPLSLSRELIRDLQRRAGGGPAESRPPAAPRG